MHELMKLFSIFSLFGMSFLGYYQVAKLDKGATWAARAVTLACTLATAAASAWQACTVFF